MTRAVDEGTGFSISGTELTASSYRKKLTEISRELLQTILEKKTELLHLDLLVFNIYFKPIATKASGYRI